MLDDIISRHIEKSKIAISQQWFGREICHDGACWPSSALRPLKCRHFKNPRWRRPQSWKIKKIATSQQRLTDHSEICHSNVFLPS